MKALIAVELCFKDGKSTCTGCSYKTSCMARLDTFRISPVPDSCPLRTSQADAAVTEAERFITESLEHGYDDERLKRALATLKKARE
jgi:hypothetical protein